MGFELLQTLISGVVSLIASNAIKPELVISFVLEEIQNTQTLTCLLWNACVKSKLLKKLGIERRTIEDLLVEFEILDDTMRKISDTIITQIKTQKNQKAERISLPVSPSPASFPVIAFSRELKVAGIVGYDTKDENLLIRQGIFYIRVKAYFGSYEKKAIQEILVSQKPPHIRKGEFRYE